MSDSECSTCMSFTRMNNRYWEKCQCECSLMPATKQVKFVGAEK